MNGNAEKLGGTCYRLLGDPETKQVIVLVHGVGLSQDIWQPWIDALGDKYCLLTYDFPGHGGSDNPPGQRVLIDFQQQLYRLLNDLNITKIHLVGFSLGALTALSFASQYQQQRLHSLTLLHSVFQRSPEQLEAIESRYRLTRDQGPMATVELAINRWFSPRWIKTNPEYIDFIRSLFRNHKDDGYLKAYRVFCDADGELDKETIAKIHCPSLVITGSLELGSTAEMAAALGKLLQARVIINEGHLHMAPVEHADLLANQVDAFIQSVAVDG